MDPQLKAQCKQTVNVASYASVSSRGDPSYGTATAIAARVEDITEEGSGADGTFVTSRKLVITESAIHLQDRVWLPGDSPSDATLGRNPLRITIAVDERGSVDHYETVV